VTTSPLNTSNNCKNEKVVTENTPPLKLQSSHLPPSNARPGALVEVVEDDFRGDLECADLGHQHKVAREGVDETHGCE